MNDRRLVDYITDSRAEGRSKEDIYTDLLERGMTVDAIQGGFARIESEEEQEDTVKRTTSLILLIGASLVGAGVFSFIASNWQELARPTKVSIIIAAMISIYSLGWTVRERLGLVKTSEAFFLLGSIMYGAGIFLVAQMFNVRQNWPDGFILWMGGTIAMAFAVESSPLFFLSILAGTVAIVSYPFGILGSMEMYDPFLLTSPVMLAAATAATFAAGLFIRRKLPPGMKEPQ